GHPGINAINATAGSKDELRNPAFFRELQKTMRASHINVLVGQWVDYRRPNSDFCCEVDKNVGFFFDLIEVVNITNVTFDESVSRYFHGGADVVALRGGIVKRIEIVYRSNVPALRKQTIH